MESAARRVYFAVFNKDDCDNAGFQYRDGMNVDILFSESGPSRSGGLWFTTVKYIGEFYHFGEYIRKIEVPSGVRAVQDGKKFRVDKLFLHPRERITGKLCREWGIPLMPMDLASLRGDVETLQLWLDSGLPLEYSVLSMEWPSENGLCKVLDWWKASGLALKYTVWAMDWASANGQTDTLDWWVASGLPLLYTGWGAELADYNGHRHVGEWWDRFLASQQQSLGGRALAVK